MKLSTFTLCTIASLIAGGLATSSARADDIDIFLGSSSGTASAPNVLFILDNTANWSKASQKWPDLPTQGEAELDALTHVMAQLYTNGTDVNIGVLMANSALPSGSVCGSASGTNSGCNGGGYLRFGARDMNNLANFTALANILGWSTAPTPLTGTSPSTAIFAKVNNPDEKINEASKDEDAAFYEAYKYFQASSSNNVFAFGGQKGNNPFADYSGAVGNAGSGNSARVAAGQGLTSGFALDNSGTKYQGPPDTTGCAKNYIIYIANNSNGNAISKGNQYYEDSTTGSAGTFVTWTEKVGAATYTNTDWPSWTPTWTKFLQSKSITTYVLDAFNAQQNVAYSASLQATAKQGGGKYYRVSTEDAILKAITDILIEIQSTNSAFAATALPASATNRSVDQNQVYLGVFRPDAIAQPRWFGNLKRFQIILNNGSPDLGDATGVVATNSVNGFLKDCSASFWTKDTSAYKAAGTAPAATDPPYWSIVPITPTPTSACPGPSAVGWVNNPANPSDSASSAQFQPGTGITWSPYSDSPDGPSVEKGGAAEVLRRGNRSATASGNDTWQVSRTLKTMDTAGTGLTDFNSTRVGTNTAMGVSGSSPTLGQIVDFASGWDSNDENSNSYTDPNAPSSPTTKETRPSLHGDVIHSTPLPITYSTSDVVVYYGSNDGMYHAVRADTGQEKWGFMAPEFYARMNRQYTNSPIVAYPSIPLSSVTPTPTPKDYFFDGSTGVYQAFNSSGALTTAYIYPTMRRGGRMLYAFDVSPATAGGSSPATPTFLWRAGCPNLGDNTGCTSTAINGIGQTWSKPQLGKIKNGSTDTSPRPMVVVGGGYDSTQSTQTINSATVVTATSCEDANSKSPSCSGRTGKGVYVIDAQSGPGTLFSAITLPGSGAGSVVGDVALLDFDGDGVIDYAYLADTTGNVYRIDFVDRTGSTATIGAKTDWPSHIYRIAHTNGSNEGRKFLFGPTLLVNQGTAAKALVYVGLGSGDREHPIASEYPYKTPVQNRFYLFLDDPTSKTTDLNLDGSSMENATPSSNAAADQIACSSAGVTGHSAVTPNSFPNPSGWYMNLNNDVRDTTSPAPTNSNGNGGEQTVTPAVIVGGQVSWGTNIPNPHVSSAACVNSLGNAYGYLVNLLNGSGAIGVSGTCGGTVSTPYTGGGLPLPPTVGTVAVTDPNTGDTTYVGVCISCPNKSGGGGSPLTPGKPFPTTGEKRTRVYWFTPNYN